MEEAEASVRIQSAWRGRMARHNLIEMMMFEDSSDESESEVDAVDEHDTRLAFLKAVPLLAELPDSELNQLAEVMANEVYEDDESIVEQGEEVRHPMPARHAVADAAALAFQGDSMYFLRRGKAIAYVKGTQVMEYSSGRCQPGHGPGVWSRAAENWAAESCGGRRRVVRRVGSDERQQQTGRDGQGDRPG